MEKVSEVDDNDCESFRTEGQADGQEHEESYIDEEEDDCVSLSILD